MQMGTVLYGKNKDGWVAMTPLGARVVLLTECARIFENGQFRKPHNGEPKPRPLANDVVQWFIVKPQGNEMVAEEWALSSQSAQAVPS